MGHPSRETRVSPGRLDALSPGSGPAGARGYSPYARHPWAGRRIPVDQPGSAAPRTVAAWLIMAVGDGPRSEAARHAEVLLVHGPLVPTDAPLLWLAVLSAWRAGSASSPSAKRTR